MHKAGQRRTMYLQVKAPRDHLDLSRQATSTGQTGLLQQSMDMDADTFASMLGNLVRSGNKAAEAKSVGEGTCSCMLLLF